MKQDELFMTYINGANQPFQGWDFSWITGTGRLHSKPLSWSYGSMAIAQIQKVNSLLDMGTGGGEFLSMLRPLPAKTAATEGYLPNLPVAKGRLEPLGVQVLQVEDDDRLPFEDGQFELILNKHESFSAKEVRRIIAERGIFLTQQVGGEDCNELNEKLGLSLPTDYTEWKLETAVRQLEENYFRVLCAKEEFPTQRFYDVGALIYYLRAIPWQAPDFDVEQQMEALYRLHQEMQSKGFLAIRQHRFLILAEAI